MKRLLALLLVLLMLFAFVGCNKDIDNNDKTGKPESSATVDSASKGDNEKEDADNKDDDKQGTSAPVLYKATDDKGNVVWLFGSIHVGRDDFYPLPSYVMDAYNGSDALAVEFDIIAFEKDIQAQMDALSALVYKDGSKISMHIDKETYDAAVSILKENKSYNSNLDYYIPAMWSSFVDQCSYEKLDVDTDNGIDKHLLKLAKKEDKKILNVESPELQYGMLADYSEELQIYMLESSVESYNNFEEDRKMLDQMIDAWASGDEESLVKLLNEEEEFESEEEEKLYEEYNNAMIVERNRYMAAYAEKMLKSGKEVFICVGSAHILGEGAVADLLKDKGYTVERVR